jgi:hypothetical protein
MELGSLYFNKLLFCVLVQYKETLCLESYRMKGEIVILNVFNIISTYFRGVGIA